jgi:hypothetical protein
MIEITLVDGLYHVKGPRCLLVLTKAELIRCLRRGKFWKRRQALQARTVGAKGKGEEHHATTSQGAHQ